MCHEAKDNETPFILSLPERLSDHMVTLLSVSMGIFHKLSTIQEYQYCQLRFSCASRNEQGQESLCFILEYNMRLPTDI